MVKSNSHGKYVDQTQGRHLSKDSLAHHYLSYISMSWEDNVFTRRTVFSEMNSGLTKTDGFSRGMMINLVHDSTTPYSFINHTTQ